MDRILRNIIGSALMLAFASVSNGEQLHPDNDIKAELLRVSALLESAQTEPEIESALSAVSSLRERYRDDEKELFAQVVQQHLSRGQSGLSGPGFVLLVKHLSISDEAKIDVILPLLEDADDESKAVLYFLLSSVSDPSGELPDYRYTVEFLRSQKGDLYKPFVEEMFSAVPDDALRLLAESTIDDPEKKAKLLRVAGQLSREQLRSINTTEVGPGQEKMSALKELCAGGEWWQQAFAANVLRNNREYRDPELVESLKTSAHPRVRNLSKSL